MPRLRIPKSDGYPFGYRAIASVSSARELRHRGRALGYPECCIREFVDDYIAGDFSALIRGVDGNGCVPCSACFILRRADSGRLAEMAHSHPI